MFGDEEVIRSHKTRSVIIIRGIFIAFAIVISRLWYLQIYKGDVLYEYSLRNRLRREIVSAPRGMIFSRNNKMLVNNIPRFDAVLTPQYLKNKKETLKKLSEILSLDVDSIKKILRKNSSLPKYKPVVIKKNISREEVARIETENNKVPGVSVEAFISREYLNKEVDSHMLGYISEITKDQIPKLRKKNVFSYRLWHFVGQYGLEEILDVVLRGEDGHEFVEVDALGRKKRHINIDNFFKGIDNRPSIPGKNLRLTIDKDMQVSAYDAIGDKVGAVVALKIDTGEVLTMVSRPGFDPSQFSTGISNKYWASLINDPRKPLINHTIQEHYPPGSTYKPIMALAALEEGVIDDRTEVTCTGSFKFGRRPFHCWKKWGHGKVDVYKAIRESCDVFFYKIATKMDIDVLSKYAMFFGLGKKTNIELDREAPGLIPTKAWKMKRFGKEWIKGEALSCVIGQSFVLTTPLQLATAYSGLASGGKIYKPFLVKEIFSNSGKVEKRFTPELVYDHPFSHKNIEIIKEALHQVPNNPKGTAWWKRGIGNDMSGKTGTSQVARFSSDKIYTKCEDLEYKFRHHGQFVAFAPRNNPQIVVSAIVEHGCSSSKAIPLVEKVISTYMKKYHPRIQEELAMKDKKMYQKFWQERAKAKELKEAKAENTDTENKEEAH
jgi:penicillin-binding protein 2